MYAEAALKTLAQHWEELFLPFWDYLNLASYEDMAFGPFGKACFCNLLLPRHTAAGPWPLPAPLTLTFRNVSSLGTAFWAGSPLCAVSALAEPSEQ